MDTVFDSLPPEYLEAVHQAQAQHGIGILPLQELRGGQTGARLYLVSIRPDRQASGPPAGVEHAILKLDRGNPKARAGEMELHEQAVRLAPADFARRHMPSFPFSPVKTAEASAIFYTIAGQSLHNYHALGSYTQGKQLETIFSTAFRCLLREWNAGACFEQALHPQSLFPRWLSYRLNPGGNIEKFMEESLGIPAGAAGLVIQGRVYPNPLYYARTPEAWGRLRGIDALVGFQHGDLNTGNILVKFSADGRKLEGFYLIDFAMFKAEVPLLYDPAYLVMSYLCGELGRMPLERWSELAAYIAAHDLPDPARAPVEGAGACAVIRAARVVFSDWVREEHPTLHDDLWAQYRLAAAAAGLNYCNKSGASHEERLAGLIYAAVHLREALRRFGVAEPADVVTLSLAEPARGAGFAPLRSAAGDAALRSRPAAVVHAGLPVAATPLIGREAEVAAAVGLLARAEVRLVTFTGPGGTGKTRLALQTGAELQANFEDGVCFISLAEMTDPGLVLTTIALRLGLRESSGQPLQENMRVYLQDKRLLLILDNFEQVMGAARDVSTLLGLAAGLKVLVTSRVLLNLSGEHEFAVPPLGLPENSETPDADSAARSAAVQLFVQRAQAAQAAFALTGENAPAVVELCRRLDGLPLAIELAAARVKLLSPQAMLARLGNRLGLLTGGARDLPARQQTLRQTIDWSYHLLEADASKLFARLAVFVGGWSLEAAEAVCNAGGDLGDVLASLETLMNSSLVRREENRDGEVRFRMLETIRAYALEQLAENGEAAQAGELHAQYYMQECSRIGFRIYTREALHWLAWIGEEHDNLRAALLWCLEPGNNVQAAVPIVGLVFWFWYRRGHLREGREWCRRVLEKLNRSVPTRQLALFMTFTAMLSMWKGDLDEGAAMIKESMYMAQMLEDDLSMSLSLMGNGVVRLNRGDAAGAMDLLQTALKLFQELKLQFFEANTLIHLGNSSLALGDLPGARAYLNRALPIAKQVGDNWLIASILNNMGEVARVEADYLQAQQYYEQSEALFRQGGDVEDHNRLVHSLGYVALYQGDTARAEELFHKSMTVFRELGMQRGIAECLAGFARLSLVRGRPVEAATLLSAASAMIRKTSADWWPADQAEVRTSLKGLHAALDEAQFELAWQAGREMGLEDALALEESLR